MEEESESQAQSPLALARADPVSPRLRWECFVNSILWVSPIVPGSWTGCGEPRKGLLGWLAWPSFSPRPDEHGSRENSKLSCVLCLHSTFLPLLGSAGNGRHTSGRTIFPGDTVHDDPLHGLSAPPERVRPNSPPKAVGKSQPASKRSSCLPPAPYPSKGVCWLVRTQETEVCWLCC